jgi:single-strand DNA-binding protein
MATRSLNKVQLIGNLTRDPELRYTPQGTAVCTFGLATNRSWVTSDGGERQEEAEFHRIVAWQKLAELCAQLLFKGRKAYVEGRLQTRNWTGKDGQERTTTEIVIDNMIVLDSRRKEESGDMSAEPGEDLTAIAEKPAGKGAKKSKAPAAVKAPASKPAKGAAKKSAPAKAGADKEEVKADDIPF